MPLLAGDEPGDAPVGLMAAFGRGAPSPGTAAPDLPRGAAPADGGAGRAGGTGGARGAGGDPGCPRNDSGVGEARGARGGRGSRALAGDGSLGELPGEISCELPCEISCELPCERTAEMA